MDGTRTIHIAKQQTGDQSEYGGLFTLCGAPGNPQAGRQPRRLVPLCRHPGPSQVDSGTPKTALLSLMPLEGPGPGVPGAGLEPWLAAHSLLILKLSGSSVSSSLKESWQ